VRGASCSPFRELEGLRRLRVEEMSTLHAAARVASRLGVVLLAGAAAAVASVSGASARGPCSRRSSRCTSLMLTSNSVMRF